jgi:hypothetical protein
MRRSISALIALLISGFALGHVTPNVTLVRRGDFVKQALPGASKYFEQSLDIEATGLAIQAATGWLPSGEEAKVYTGRDDQGRAVGRVVFLWLPSEHGPVGIGVAFDTEGRLRQATVTDVGTEPLTWVRPLVEGLGALSGLALNAVPDAGLIAPAATGKMSRYYAEVIAGGVRRAQAIESALRGRSGR